MTNEQASTRFSKCLLNNRLLVIVVIGIATLFFLHILGNIKLDENIDRAFMGSDPDYKKTEQFLQQNGQGTVIVIAVETPDDVLSRESVAMIQGLTEGLEQLENLSSVISLSNIANFSLSDKCQQNIVQNYLEGKTGRCNL